MKRVIVVLLMLVVLFLVMGSAELSVSEPGDIYNLGDKLYITVTDVKGSDNGNLNIDLVCSNSTVNLLKISARAFSLDGGQAYSIPYKILTKDDLEIDDLSVIVGSCTLRTNLASNVVVSKSFTISNNLNVNANIDKLKFNPGDEATIDIDVKRADGQPFDGLYKISNFTSIAGTVEDGSVIKNFKIPTDMPAGEYFIAVEAYSVGSDGDIMNSGSANFYVIVSQVPTSIEFGLSDLEIVPGNDLKINPAIVLLNALYFNKCRIYSIDYD